MSAIVLDVGYECDDGYQRVYRNELDEVGVEIQARPSIGSVSFTLRGNGESMATLVALARSLEERILERRVVSDEALATIVAALGGPK